MQEELEWKKRESRRPEFLENLDYMMKNVVMAELKDINNKIESLCSMGIIKDEDKLKEIREKMKQLQESTGTKNDSFKE
jgi:hypothetical protein